MPGLPPPCYLSNVWCAECYVMSPGQCYTVLHSVTQWRNINNSAEITIQPSHHSQRDMTWQLNKILTWTPTKTIRHVNHTLSLKCLLSKDPGNNGTLSAQQTALKEKNIKIMILILALSIRVCGGKKEWMVGPSYNEYNMFIYKKFLEIDI